MLRICQLVGWQIVKIDHFSDEHQREADFQVGRHLLSELLQLWSLILSRVLKIDLIPVSLSVFLSLARGEYIKGRLLLKTYFACTNSAIFPRVDDEWWMTALSGDLAALSQCRMARTRRLTELTDYQNPPKITKCKLHLAFKILQSVSTVTPDTFFAVKFLS